jgi:lysyl-tRNA synthetase class 2
MKLPRPRSTRPRLAVGNRLLATVVLAAAWINGLFALALSPSTRFEVDPTANDPRVWAGLVAAALVPLGWGILRRRRGAWVLSLAVVAGAVVADLLSHDEPSELILPIGAFIVLLLARDLLVAEPYRETLRRHAVPTRRAMQRTQELLEAYGRDAMAPFKLREDVGHLFSEAGDAVLAFRVENRALLVASDPIGTDEGVAEVLNTARRLARGAGLRFGVVAASEELCERMRTEYGMRSIYLGCEAVVETASFTLEGHKIKKVRQAYNRVRREGFELETVRLAELGAVEREALLDCRHRARPGEDETTFAMSPESFDAPGSEHSIVVRARRASDGHVAGFMVFMPLVQRSMWSLAVQLRDPASPNGVMDALIAHALMSAREEGVEELSLNFAAARRYVHEPVHGFWPRVARVLAYLAMRWTQIDTLRAHNEKFSPRWEKRSVILEHVLEAPHLAFAVIWQEGQLPRPDALIRPAWPQRSDPLPSY